MTKPLGDQIVAVTKRPIDVDPDVLEKVLRKLLFPPKDDHPVESQHASRR